MAKTFSSLSLLCSLLFRHTAMFKRLVGQQGEGPAAVHSQGRQHREEHLLEVLER